MTHVLKPSLKHARVVAKALVEAHPFLKDDEGDGEVCFFFNLFWF